MEEVLDEEHQAEEGHASGVVAHRMQGRQKSLLVAPIGNPNILLRPLGLGVSEPYREAFWVDYMNESVPRLHEFQKVRAGYGDRMDLGLPGPC